MPQCHAAVVLLAIIMGLQVELAWLQTVSSDAFDRDNQEFYRFGRDFVLYRPPDSESLLAQSWAFRLPSQHESEPISDGAHIRGRRQFYRFGRAPEKRFLRFGRSRHSDVEEDDAALEPFSEYETQFRKRRSLQYALESRQSQSRTQRSAEVTRKTQEEPKSRDVSDNLQHAEMQNVINGEPEQTYLSSSGHDEPDFQKRFMRFGKRFMRFGRGGGDLAEDKRFMRFGRRLDKDDTDFEKRFMRFGKSVTYLDDKDKRFMRFGKSVEDYDKDKRFMRFGKSVEDYEKDKRFMRFGKSVGDNDKDKQLMRLGKSAADNDAEKRFMRFGKSVGDDDKDKRFMRFGKSILENDDTEKRFMRFGKSLEPLVSENNKFMRFGKKTSYADIEQDKRFMRFGKRFMRFGKRFMRFGRGDEDLLANSDERSSGVAVVRHDKMQR